MKKEKGRMKFGVLSGVVGIVLNVILSVFKMIFGAITRKYENCISVCGTHGKTTTTAISAMAIPSTSKFCFFIRFHSFQRKKSISNGNVLPYGSHRVCFTFQKAASRTIF